MFVSAMKAVPTYLFKRSKTLLYASPFDTIREPEFRKTFGSAWYTSRA